jgi:opacity protein-like surface antigen
MISKKILVAVGALSTVGFSSMAYADDSMGYYNYAGFYVGAQAGYGNPDYGNDLKKIFQTAPNYSTKEGGLAGRAYLGYQFNDYFGLEAGYTLFSNNTYEGSDQFGNRIKLTVKTQQADILGKLGMPFGDSGFRGDLKAGAAYVRTSVDATASGIDSNLNTISQSGSGSQNRWDPAAGAAISYNFTQNFAMDVSYLHAFGSGDTDSPNTDLVTIGVSYLFA